MLILASASPRRKELLGTLIETFAVLPSGESEEIDPALSPEETVQELARQKAESVFFRHPDDVVLGADTVVVLDGEILGKPADAADARRMLHRLAGREHRVLTGVCLIAGGREIVRCEESAVVLSPLTEAEIDAYVATGSPLDKAGAYGIQDKGIVASYRGSRSNVMGLPLEAVERMLLQTEVLHEQDSD